jgi:hypothetical protein
MKFMSGLSRKAAPIVKGWPDEEPLAETDVQGYLVGGKDSP